MAVLGLKVLCELWIVLLEHNYSDTPVDHEHSCLVCYLVVMCPALKDFHTQTKGFSSSQTFQVAS